MAPGVFGTVSSINGMILTVSSKTPRNASTTTVYTVDASNATVYKNGATSTVAAIAVGDNVMIQGTVSGTNVTAKTIRDGIGKPGIIGTFDRKAPATSTIVQGNGEPVVGGSVTAISGTTTLTVTNKSNVTYTVDVSNAKVEKAGTSTTVSAIAVGDNVIVQGTVNGTSVTASSVIDSGNPTTIPAANPPKASHGFFTAIGNFFQKLFGF